LIAIEPKNEHRWQAWTATEDSGNPSLRLTSLSPFILVQNVFVTSTKAGKAEG